MKYIKYVVLVLILCPVLLAVGYYFVYLYNPTSRIPDPSILTQEPCKFPCWYGLIPGIHKQDEVLQTIESLGFVDHSTLLIEDYPDKHRKIISWYHKVGEFWGPFEYHRSHLVLDNDELSSVKISPLVNYTIQDIISLYGQPKLVNVSSDSYVLNSTLEVNLYLLYPEIGAIFQFRDIIEGGASKKQYIITDTMKGITFYLFKPTEDIPNFISAINKFSSLYINQSNTIDWSKLTLPFVVLLADMSYQTLTP